MLISGKSSRISVRVYNQAEQLARTADQVTKDLLNVEIPLRDIQTRIAGLAKEYVGLYMELKRRQK